MELHQNWFPLISRFFPPWSRLLSQNATTFILAKGLRKHTWPPHLGGGMKNIHLWTQFIPSLVRPTAWLCFCASLVVKCVCKAYLIQPNVWYAQVCLHEEMTASDKSNSPHTTSMQQVTHFNTVKPLFWAEKKGKRRNHKCYMILSHCLKIPTSSMNCLVLYSVSQQMHTQLCSSKTVPMSIITCSMSWMFRWGKLGFQAKVRCSGYWWDTYKYVQLHSAQGRCCLTKQ